MANGFNHAANLPVAPLGNGDPVPTVGALAPAVFNRAELRHAIVQHHAGQQGFLLFGTQGPKNAHGIFPLQTESGVHQLIGQVAGAGEKQQALGVQVQTPHRLPFTLEQLGQAAKNRGAVLRIVMRNDLARRLVISDHAGCRRINAEANRLAIDLDGVAKLDPLPDMRRLVVDGDTPLQDELLHLQAGTHARLRQYLVQLGRLHLRGQNALGRRFVDPAHIFCVELARNNVQKWTRMGWLRCRRINRQGILWHGDGVHIWIGRDFGVIHTGFSVEGETAGLAWATPVSVNGSSALAASSPLIN